MADLTPAEMAGAKILIVDDVPANLDVLRNILASGGYRIFFATSGEAALRVATEVLPDVILLDVTMPQMDGFETCRRLKKIDGVREIPVIFVTGRTEIEDLAKGFDVGGVDYITKPIKRPEVEARVRTHLQIQDLILQQKEHLVALQRSKEELQELNATKDKFFSILAKDLRGPLAAIAQVSASLRRSVGVDGPVSDRIDQQLQGVTATAETVLGLMENLLEWPRVQTGQKLDLFDSPVANRDLEYLVQGLNKLRFLSLADTRVTDQGLAHVARLAELRELHLDNTVITDDGLRHLTALRELLILDLKGTQVTDAGLEYLTPLENLQGLYLTRTAITDDGLVPVGRLRNLRTLILWDTGVTDAGLHHLHGLAHLSELILWGTDATAAGAATLRDVLPDCDVSVDMAE
ncbi:MAG: response regulator [Nitrospirota bacterium]|jgi:CheY-like chemotaxis protein